MKKNIFKNSLVVGIIIVFFSSSFISNISGFSNNNSKEDIDFENSYESQEKVVISCQTYGIPGKSLKQLEMSKTKAEKLLGKINALTEIIANYPLSYDIKQLQDEIIYLAKDYDLIPEDISLEELQPRFFTQLDLKRSKKGILPVIGNRGTASFCNFATAGEGSQFPIIILPRLIPILLTPIPRAFLHWSANIGVTTCGSYLTGTGFIASGMQRGTALCFWGIGFSVFLPPVMAYGFIGYALFTTCTAEEIEPWPPNYAPEVSAVSPADGTDNVAISTSELSFQISDENGDLMDYTVTTIPNIGSGGDNNKPGGTYSIPISGLEGTEEYTWYIEVSDGEKTTDASFSFETEPVAPIVSDPNPEDSERYVPISISQLNFHLKDPQGDLMDYTVETSPDIGSGSGIDVGEGTYSIDVSGLDYSQEYRWFVNVTDGENWKDKAYSFQADHKKVFDPFDEGWQYRKKITINHTKVTGDIVNFPVLINSVDTDLRDKGQENGDDILFMDGPGVANRLYHEIEKFEGSTGELVVWVNVTSLVSDQDTMLYMYYGSPSCCSQESPEMVWDSNYVGVWHMSESSGDIIDSTRTKDGIVDGSPDYKENGKIGNCVYLDGETEEYFDITDDTYKFKSEDLTLEAWVKYTDNRNLYETIFYIGDKGDFYPNVNLAKMRSGHPDFGGNLYVRNYQTNGPYEAVYDGSHIDYWVYQVGTFDRGTELAIYIDGGKEGIDDCSYNDLTVGNSFCGYIGRGGAITTYEKYSKFYIDELRISKNIARSEEWISTTYNNQNDPLGFLSFGPEETAL